MRLLTYQQLCCIRNTCEHEYPLQLHINTNNTNAVESIESDCSRKFITNLVNNNNLDYQLVRNVAINQLGIDTLPDIIPDPLTDEFISELHTIMLDIHIMDGYLQCSKCERKYPIQSGIPNMRLNEDEITTQQK